MQKERSTGWWVLLYNFMFIKYCFHIARNWKYTLTENPRLCSNLTCSSSRCQHTNHSWLSQSIWMIIPVYVQSQCKCNTNFLEDKHLEGSVQKNIASWILPRTNNLLSFSWTVEPKLLAVDPKQFYIIYLWTEYTKFGCSMWRQNIKNKNCDTNSTEILL